MKKAKPIVFSIIISALIIVGIALAGFDYSKRQSNASASAANPTTTSQQGPTAFPSLPPPPSDLTATPSASTTPANVNQTAIISSKKPAPARPSVPPTPIIVPKMLPWSAPTFTVADWVKDWGGIETAPTSLSVNALATTTGAATFLTGSNQWINYDFEASVAWTNGKTFALIARQADTNNFVFCNFTAGSAQIFDRVDGNDQTVASANIQQKVVGSVNELGIRTYANKVACSINGNDVVTAAISTPEPPHGGIGFTAWDPAAGVSTLTVTEVSVKPMYVDTIALPQAETSMPTSTAAPTSTPAATPAPAPASTTPTSTSLALPYLQTDFSGDNNWTSTWGSAAVTSAKAIDLFATPQTSGAEVIFQSADWGNFKATVNFNWLKGRTFDVLGRFADDSNYTACHFEQVPNTGVTFQIVQKVNGDEMVLATGMATGLNAASSGPLTATLDLRDTYAVCSLGHYVISSQGTGHSLNPPYTGKIGFSVWDPNRNNNSEVIVNSVDVESNQ